MAIGVSVPDAVVANEHADEVSDAYTSATGLLRSLKISTTENFHTRLLIAESALRLREIPRVRDIIRQWILDEWLATTKRHDCPILDIRLHELFAQVVEHNTEAPLNVVERAVSAMQQQQTPIPAVPMSSLSRMISAQPKGVAQGRWTELWTKAVKWLGDAKVSPSGMESLQKSVGNLFAAIFRQLRDAESQGGVAIYRSLLSVLPDMARIIRCRSAVGTSLLQQIAQILMQLPTDALASVVSQAADIPLMLSILPAFLRQLAIYRNLKRHSIFNQPSSSKVPYETYIAQCLNASLLDDFRQAFEVLDGLERSTAQSTVEIWRGRLGLWEVIRGLDMRIDSSDAWRSIVIHATRKARSSLESERDSDLERASLAVLACLFQLDHQTVALTESDVQSCLAPSLFGTAESDMLLSALVRHHRLQRTPAAFTQMLCDCITGLIGTSGHASKIAIGNFDFSEPILASIHDLISDNAATRQCWSIITAASKRVSNLDLSGQAPEPTMLLARLTAGLLARGNRSDLSAELLLSWPVDVPGDQSLRDSPSGDWDRTALTAGLTVRAMLPVGGTPPPVKELLSLLRYAESHAQLDIAILRYCLVGTKSTGLSSELIDALLVFLRNATLEDSDLWTLINQSTLRRLNRDSSESQLDLLARLMLSHPDRFRHVLQSSNLWELHRLTTRLVDLDSGSDAIPLDMSFAFPPDLRRVGSIASQVEKVSGSENQVARVEKWLLEIDAEILMDFPTDIWYDALVDPTRCSLAQVIVGILLQHNIASHAMNTMTKYIQFANDRLMAKGKPCLSDVERVLAVVDQIRHRHVSWFSLPTDLQAELRKIGVLANGVLRRNVTKGLTTDKLAITGRLGLALKSFSAWSQTGFNASSSGLLSRLLQSGDLADPALPLLLGASLDIEGDQFIATYHYLRRVRNPPVIDNAMSSIINTLEFETYAKLWVWATTSAESSLLRILCSSDREGSGKIIRSRLAQILALMQAGTVDTVVLAVLWRDRARCFTANHAIDSWGILSSNLVSPSPAASDHLTTLLDAAIVFTSQRTDLLPDTTVALASTLCSLFAFFRGRTDADLAKKTARLLDSLCRNSSIKRKRSGSTHRHTTSRIIATHLPMLLVAYARACTDPVQSIPASVRTIIDPSLADLCSTIDTAAGRAFDSIGVPYGLGEGLGGEAEVAVWAGIWRSWKRKRYIGQG